jgi:hypothetical protein
MSLLVSISLNAAGGFDLKVPSTLEGRSHTIHVPANMGGIAVMRKVLSAQAKEISAYERKLGFEASPTQAQVNAWLAQDRLNRQLEKEAAEEKKEAERTAAAKVVLNGIDLGDLDL